MTDTSKKRYGTYEMVNGGICNDLMDRVDALETFVESITLADGPYPELNGTPIVRAAYEALSTKREVVVEDDEGTGM